MKTGTLVEYDAYYLWFFLMPDRTFHNFEAKYSSDGVDQRFLVGQNSCFARFFGSKIVKSSVR